MRLKISRINIYLHIQKGKRSDERFKRRVFNLFSRPASLLASACLPTYLRRTSVDRNWNEIRNTLNNVRRQDLLLHVGKPVRESDTRFVPPWQAYSSFREFIPQFTTCARARAHEARSLSLPQFVVETWILSVSET